MSVAVAIAAWPQIAWWIISPAVSLAIGWRRGRPLAGWLCGLVPLAGPFIAARLPRW